MYDIIVQKGVVKKVFFCSWQLMTAFIIIITYVKITNKQKDCISLVA